MEQIETKLVPSSNYSQPSMMKIIYELLSIGHGLAILAFFGIVFLAPIEMMILSHNNNSFWSYITIAGATIISFYVFKFKPEKTKLYIRIAEIVGAVLTVSIVFDYFYFAQTLSEPWLFQLGWYIHRSGEFLALYLGIISFKTGGIMVAVFSEWNDQSTPCLKNNHVIALILTFAIVFLILFLQFLRFVGVFHLILVIFLLQMIFMSVAALQIMMPQFQSSLAFHYTRYCDDRMLDRIATRKKIKKNGWIYRYLSKMDRKGIYIDHTTWDFTKDLIYIIALLMAFDNMTYTQSLFYRSHRQLLWYQYSGRTLISATYYYY